jgi:hypothetical protein
MKAEPLKPGPGLSTSAAAFSELIKGINQRNEGAQKAAQKLRAIRDSAERHRRQEWDRA